jgi:glutathione S-transferase
MFKVYGRRGAGSAVVEALLEEIGLPYEVESVERATDGLNSESLLAVNPLREVPALVLPDGSVMTESGAMVVYLADLYPAKRLAPAAGDLQRGSFLRWVFFLAANIYQTNLRFYYPARYVSDTAAASSVKIAAEKRIAIEWQVFADGLGPKPFILGETMSAADIYAAMLAAWHPDMPAFFAQHGNIETMYRRVVSRPAVAKVWKRNDL